MDLDPENLDGIDEASLAALYSYWMGKRTAEGAWPPRAAIEPTEIPRLLPYIMLVEIHGPEAFYFRLVGTNVANGIDPTGRYLADGAPSGPYRQHILSLYGEMPRRRTPIYSVSHYDMPTLRDRRRIHRIFLPLTAAQDRAPLMLVGQVTEGDMAWNGSLWEIPPEHIEVVKLRELEAARPEG